MTPLPFPDVASFFYYKTWRVFVPLQTMKSGDVRLCKHMINAMPLRPFASLKLALIPTLFVVLFLFYIDEGWYSFRWMLDWGNWIVFVIYTLVLLPVFWLPFHFLFPRQHGSLKFIITSLICISIVLSLFGHFIFK